MYTSSPGIDRINRKTFEKDLSTHLKTIVRKVNNGTYKFSKYREKLISKGRDKAPRVISIPTIRDKIVLRALCNILLNVLHSETQSKLPQTIIHEIKNEIESGKFDYFFKIDIKNFYPSIKHDILLKKIRRKIKKPEILNLIEGAISQETYDSSQYSTETPTQGVPQGLSISNILASLYLNSLDEKQSPATSYSYFRYVDDILVLCSSKDSKFLEEKLIKDLELLGLNTHCDSPENCEKQDSGSICKSVTYLGYKFSDNQISVKRKSIDNIKNSIMKLFAENKYTNSTLKIFEWKINLRITGCMFENKKYGWVFYFSQLTDLKILFELDFLVKKLCERYRINLSKIKLKKFIRSYSETTKNLQSTSYIPNFSNLDTIQKKAILVDVFRMKENELTDEKKNRHTIQKTYKKLNKRT